MPEISDEESMGSLGEIAEASGTDLPMPKDDLGGLGGRKDFTLGDLQGLGGDEDLPAPVGLDLPAPLGLDLPTPRRDLELPTPRGDFDLPTPKHHLDLPTPKTRSDVPTSVGLDLPAPVDLDGLEPVRDLEGLEPVRDLHGLEPVRDLQGLEPARDLHGLEPVQDLHGLEPIEDLNLPEPVADSNMMTPIDDVPLPSDSLAGLGHDLDLDHRPAEHSKADILPGLTRSGEHRAGAPSPNPAPLNPGSGAGRPAVSRGIIYGGLAVLLVGGGLGAAFFMGVFDKDPEVQARGLGGAEGKQPQVPAGEVAERNEAIFAKLDEDTPQSYQQAMAMAESVGDKVGQAEAALLLHYRYGPDGVLAGQASALLEPYKSKKETHVTRVFALAALVSGNPDAALEGLTGTDPQSTLYKAWATHALEDGEKAKAYAEQVSATRPKNMAAVLLAKRVDSERDPESGLAALRASADEHGDHPRHQLELAQALFKLGYLGEASDRAATIETPKAASAGYQASVLGLRGQIAAAQGRPAAAVRFFDEAIEAVPGDVGIRIDRIRMLLDTGDFGTVRGDIDTLTSDHGKNLQVVLLTGDVAVAAGEGDQALEIAARLAKALPEGDLRPKLLEGRVYAMRMRVDDALPLLEEVRAAEPTMLMATTEQARILRRSNRQDEARTVFDKTRKALAEAKAPTRIRADLLVAYADFLDAPGAEPEERLALLEEAISINSGHNRARLLRGLSLLRKGEIVEGQNYLVELHERTGGYPGLASPLGRIYLRRGELDELDKLIGDELEDERAPDDIVLTGALLRMKQDRLTEAKALVTRVLASKPDSWEAHLVKGQILLADNDLVGGLAEIEQARPPSPHAEVELWLGQALEYNGRTKEAMPHYEQAIALDPTLDEARALYGRILAYSGAAKQAIAMLDPVIERSDDYPYAYVARGRAHADQGKTKQAIADFKKGQELNPTDFEAFYWEGRLQANKNKHGAAAAALGKATELAGEGAKPRLVDAYRLLGDAQLALGKKSEAKAAYTKYLELAPPKAAGRVAVQRVLDTL